MTKSTGKPREVVGQPTSAEYTPPEPPKKAAKASKDQEAASSGDEE